MSRLYDSIEPSVIDDALLRKCIEEQGPDGEAGKIAKQEGIEFKEVLQIKLSYKSKKFVAIETYSYGACIRYSANGEFVVCREFN